jgi:Ser/Thr protein kinase RdoA (MazF antagonist)
MLDDGSSRAHARAYQRLNPDQVLDAVESQGFPCDGRMLALNSFENRVYQVGLEDGEPVIAKFYRPARWSDGAIQEEHDFARQLADADVPVVPPLADTAGRTLFRQGPFRFALFPRVGGRAPQLDNQAHLEQLGRFLGRLHAVGAAGAFRERPSLNLESYGIESYRFLLKEGFIPPELTAAYRSLAEDLIQRIQWCFERAGDVGWIRTHADFHMGNILWTETGPRVVDLDDARTAPAVQDLWMLISGERGERTWGLHAVLDGYTQFRDFDPRELHLVEALRTLRMMHYYAWIARRWTDPAFPRMFSWFNTQRCWEDHILALREQAAAMDEEPLHWP